MSAKLPRYTFLTSAAELRGCPEDNVPEVAIAGRSNAGKSSFINALAQSKIAKVSSTPGKTRLLNFFQSSTNYRLVDMPGYGYASIPGDEQSSWADMIEPFLSSRGNVGGVLLLMDIRRHWSRDELDLVRWLNALSLPVLLVLTKADKVTQAERSLALKENLKKAGIPTLACSALKKTGFIEIEEFLFREFVQPKRGAK